MLTIYTPTITPRIAFIMDVVFKEHLNIAYRLTESVADFDNAELKISYALQPLAGEVFIWQHPLLMESEIREQTIDSGLFDGEITFFQSAHDRSFISFDIFSFSFFLLSRYEEYLPHRKDKYGRFAATESVAYRFGFLQKPLVDIVVLKFAKKLQEAIPGLKLQPSDLPEYLATYDIDNAYAYKYKGLVRSLGGLSKLAIRFKWGEAIERIAVLMNLKKDPFDTYEYIQSLQQRYDLDTYYFILFAEKDKHDRGLSPDNKHFHRLLKQLDETAKVGSHPSFASHLDKEKQRKEITGLSSVLQKEITFCRSHFLLLDFPETYRGFIENGMVADFTLGYADQVGFRASTCKPFYFFDLSSGRETSLRIYPFSYMEETLKVYMRLSGEEGLEVIKKLIDQVKSVNGVFISLWHNENFEKRGWHGWKKVYEQSLDYFFANR